MRVHPVLLLALAATAACSSPSSPSPPSTGPLAISCPADITFTSFDGRPVNVPFAAPIIQGGTPPVASTCDPVSGGSFPLGRSTVGCKATDSAGQAATCTFSVTVLPPPKLSATNFVAFGNSLTEGKLSDGTIDTLNAYPAKLQGLLFEHYATQQFSVLNRGLGGETTAEGMVRLAGVLARDQAEVLLLDEGVNDLLKNVADASGIVSNLRQMIHQATGRHMSVFVTTLAPAPRLGSADSVESTNALIRAMAPAESAFLVDAYAALVVNVPGFIGGDGLHPTPAGYQRMAETFFDAIRAHLEVTATAQDRLGLLSPPGRRRQQFR